MSEDSGVLGWRGWEEVEAEQPSGPAPPPPFQLLLSKEENIPLLWVPHHPLHNFGHLASPLLRATNDDLPS